ncbi:hypothetical protein E2P81_ATG10266 [Venturia nashicola]|nr:hypothetical protein E2P81_ATG10266 [Venturia nashicola]
MGQATQELLIPFLGALQASVAVLLTISVGVIASQFQLIGIDSSKEISKVAVRLFLPALLIVNVGSQLHSDTAFRYVPIVIWSIFYQLASLAVGVAASKFFKLPKWVTPAFAFNNTTSLPLLLVQSLDAAGILSGLDSSSGVVDRAKSYFLVNAMISNSLTFALGPKFLDCPDDIEASDPKDPMNNRHHAEELESQQEEDVQENEETSLLPQRAARHTTRGAYSILARCQTAFAALPTPVQETLSFLSMFLNPPFIGTCIGALIGLVPALHTLFFEDQQHGGYLNAWLTAALKNVGELFAALQVIVVGIKLSSSLLKWKKGESSGHMPWDLGWSSRLCALFCGRPSLSRSFTLLRQRRGPWIKIPFCDVSGADETQKLSIAKFLTVQVTRHGDDPHATCTADATKWDAEEPCSASSHTPSTVGACNDLHTMTKGPSAVANVALTIIGM